MAVQQAVLYSLYSGDDDNAPPVIAISFDEETKEMDIVGPDEKSVAAWTAIFNQRVEVTDLFETPVPDDEFFAYLIGNLNYMIPNGPEFDSMEAAHKAAQEVFDVSD